MSPSVLRYARATLFASTALLALPAGAFADSDASRPTGAIEEPHSGAAVGPIEAVETPQAATGLVTVTDEPQITINNNFTPAQVFDPTNITGVGQIVVDAGGGSVGLCTATKINPRVVIFAAHCVNTAAATTYGANSGGTAIAIGFETNTRANAAGQPDELVNWLLGGSTGPGQFKTNQAQSLYNLNQVFWNPASRAAASCTSATSCFLEGDIATGVMDTPSLDAIPTWAMLFSPLPTPGTINTATGTGYHVVIDGYGRNGNGTTGAVGNDFRRRVAENMLGALTSISERNAFLFGTPGSPNRPQLLYWLDFDDPARGTATANPFDFNGFRDNALPREGLTGPGDSGGPLILDRTYAKQLVLGVLSGGSTFFTGQVGGSYGTQSFYQPLFLYWDWIVANNPYRYVSATAGNKNWEDATAWVTELDPAYYVITGTSAANPLGNAVNGLPTNLGGTNTVTTPNFGEFCFQDPSTSSTPATNECQNTNGTVRNNVPNGTGDSSPTLTALITDLATPDNISLTAGETDDETAGERTTGGVTITRAGTRAGLDGAFESPSADPGYSTTVNPAPTLANGLPGATNFVPNNVDGVRATGVAGRYYDVTLRNAGIVTLNSTVTVDRFTVFGSQSQLAVASGASLTSLLSLNQLTGVVNVNGTVNSVGDYLFTSGLLTGTGRVNAPFLTSVMGNFAPGTVGTVGTLTIGGNLAMASASTYAVDLGSNGVSDRLVVVANGTSTGLANLGGNLQFNYASGASILAGNTYTILTSAAGRIGTFNTPTALSAILTPQVSYTPNAVQVTLVAGTYVNVGLSGPVPTAYAYLLDRNRTTTSLAGLYSYLDLQSKATLQATLDSWAPRGEVLKSAIGTASIDNMNRFFRSRIGSMDVSNGLGGSVAVLGNPLQTASLVSTNQAQGGQMLMNYGGPGESPTTLPETMSAFFAGGYLDGESDSMATAVPFGQIDNFDGYYLAAGIETEVGENAGLGFAFSYTDMDGTTGGATSSADGQLYQGTIYGKAEFAPGTALDVQLSAALFSASTDRSVAVGPTTYRLQSKDDTLALSGEVGLSKMFKAGMLNVGPRAAMRFSRIDFTPTVETGGGPALAFNRGQYSSVQGVAGLTLSGGMKVRPYASAYYVHEFEDKPASFGANFVGGIGLPAAFALAGTDHDWFEASAGIAFGSDKIQVSLGADTTIGRDDVSNQSYRGSVTFRF